MIPDEVVEQVSAAADIVAIIGEHVRLKKMGGVYRGPCPFHQGTNNNFSVMPKGGYTCFVCGEKGSVFTFVQKRLGLSFVEAVKYVGEKSGIEVKETERKREGPDPREPLWELNATVAAWFKEMLWDNALGQQARDYLAKRGIARETADKFGMGFAPREIGLMRSYLNALGFNDDRLLATGLLVKREEQDEPRPRFRDRLIFPITDPSGHTVGFGGRLLGPGEPKYLNSAETAAFSKGKTLYNLAAARNAIRKDDRVILVEGYFDVVRLVEAGIECVVAPMGTALAEGQADLLSKYSKTAFLLYDSDAPGQKASFRAGDILLSRGMTVRVVTLPDGEDPDTFVAKFGGDAMEKLLTAALDIFDRKVQLLERGGWFSDLQKKRRALDALMPTIRSTTDSITRDLYIGRVAAAAGVDRAVLISELGSTPRASARPAARRAPPPNDPDEPAPTRVVPDGPYRGAGNENSAERELIRVMLLLPAFVEEIMERVGRLEEDVGMHPPEMEDEYAPDRGAIRDPVYRAIFDAVALNGAEASIEQIAESLDAQAIGVVEALKSEPGAVVDPRATVDGSVRLLRERLMQEKLGDLERMTPLASGEEKDALIRETDALRKELTALGGRSWRSVRRPAG